MKNRTKQIKEIFKDVSFVSKLTGTLNKKLVIFLAILTSNLTALLDIIIILSFTLFLTGSFDSFNIIEGWIEIVTTNIYLLPFIILFRYLSKITQTYLLKNLEVTVEKNLRIYVLSEVFKQKDFSISDAYFYINKITAHIAFFYSSLTNLLNFILQSGIYFLYLLLTDSTIITAFAAGIFVLFIPIKKLIISSKNYMHKTFIFEKISDDEIQKVLDNIYLIKILKKDEDELNKFEQTSDQVADGQLKNHLLNALSADLPSFITIFAFSVFISYFGNLNFITLDYIAITLRLFQSVGGTTGALSRVINSQIHISKLKEIVNTKDSFVKHDYDFKIKNKKNDVELDSVFFKYRNSTDWLFENINLEFKQNTHTIITGQNGSGKSTLLGLISGLLVHEKGKIQIGREKLGYIGPTPLILTTTLKENLMYGNQQSIDNVKILEVCEIFQLFEKVNEEVLLKQVTNTSLSSGQMQKIGFIRAILSDVEILLLDESTSNLDVTTKSLIFQILENKNITIINSTHDPTSFLKVDRNLRIDLMENKRIIYDL
jgi:ABC-type multidrug transport system fused ATPase/permease subunit